MFLRIILAISFFIYLPHLPAQEVHLSLQENQEYLSALDALEDNLPGVAAQKLFRLLETPHLTEKETFLLQSKCIEACVRSGKSKQALALIKHLKPETFPEIYFWQGLALAGLGQFADAEKILEQATNQPHSLYKAEAILTRANLLLSLGNAEQALHILSPLFKSENSYHQFLAKIKAAEIHLYQNSLQEAEKYLLKNPPTKKYPHLQESYYYLQGRLYLEQKKFLDAKNNFQSLLENKKNTTLPIHRAATLGLAQALYENKENEEATKVATTFIQENPTSPLLSIAFNVLEQAQGLVTPLLEKWTTTEHQELKAHATFYLALVQMNEGKTEIAIDKLEDFKKSFPNHFFLSRALLSLSKLYTSIDQREKAIETLRELDRLTINPTLKEKIQFLEGETNFHGQDFALAAENFRQQADTQNKKLLSLSLYNAGIAYLKTNDKKNLTEIFITLSQNDLLETFSNLLLESAFYLAETDPTEALKNVHLFIQQFPDHPRLNEARILLCDHLLMQFPENTEKIEENLLLINTSEIAPHLQQRVHYLHFWVAQLNAKTKEALTLGKQFLETWPQAPLSPEIQMKLGELYLRNKEYGNALIEFEKLVQDYPDSPFKETALFLAGKASLLINTPQSIDKAITIWKDVIDQKGSLALHARYYQTKAKQKQGKLQEALLALEAILKENPAPQGELLFSILHDKGKIEYSLGSQSPKNYDNAIASFAKIISHPKAPLSWKNQASFYQGKCYKELEEPDKALEIFYDVINFTSSRSHGESQEYYWYFQCGEEALNLLKEQNKWKAAIAIAEKLGESSGKRAEIARKEAESLKLKHFLWEE